MHAHDIGRVFKSFAEMDLADARRITLQDSTEVEKPSTSGSHFSESNFRDQSNVETTKVCGWHFS